jgi:hypothetical protein
MPTIEITPSTFSKLQQLGTAFVDTPETVIARLADEALAARQAATPVQHRPPGDPNLIELDPFFTGNLAHTRVRRASFGALEVDPPQWNNLLRIAHVVAFQALGGLAPLKEASSARLREGRYEREGYKYVPAGNFSIQGLDSNLAWASSLRLAKKVGATIEVEFEWYAKEAAAHPGKRGHILWEPEGS